MHESVGETGNRVVKWVFRLIVTTDSGIVTTQSGIATSDSDDRDHPGKAGVVNNAVRIVLWGYFWPHTIESKTVRIPSQSVVGEA